ncbi:hypothetical protein [Actinomadura fibrosa]|uniref:Uncharacterized protein n=1 Tax=Actinomadura fibrosa TaxID=111802 RepID=A0ABW2XRX1_9ACTN|nr:hypothetical protein [Actinomadura fibrosa]
MVLSLSSERPRRRGRAAHPLRVIPPGRRRTMLAVRRWEVL